MNIIIKYDTVSFETQIICDDNTIQDNLEQTIQDIRNKRITDWFEMFIRRVKEEYNNDSFSIKINGCDIYEKVYIETILVKEAKYIVDNEICYLTESNIKRNYDNIDAFIDYAINSENEIVKDAIKPNLEKIKNLRSNKVEVPVIATMSSGKSTLLNALIGKDFLFEDTGAATATTCNIKINNKLEKFLAQAIDDDKILEETEIDISNFLKNWNSSANKDSYSNLRLNLEGPVEHLNSSSLELNFIDTPGPNSAQHKNHTKKTYSYLKDNQNLPIVLYVLDPEKIDSKDDDNTLKEISDVLKSNQQNLERIIFIYNKIDREDLDKKPYSEILLKIQKFLSRYNIENSKIFPLSAKYAKLAQIINDLSRNDKNKLNSFRNDFIPVPEENYPGYQLLDYVPLNNTQKEQLVKNISRSELDADLVYSGLAAINLYIEDYITNHHQKKQYKDLMDIARNVSNVVMNKIELKKNSLKEKTNEEKLKKEEQTKNEIIELEKKKKNALQAISKIKSNSQFIDNIAKKVDLNFSKIKQESSNKSYLDHNEAKKLEKKVNKTISNLIESIETDLVSKMNDEVENYLTKLKNEVFNKFGLNSNSIELKTFNAEISNKINVIGSSDIFKYSEVIKETKIKEEKIDIKSDKWYKRILFIKETVTIKIPYVEEKELINGNRFFIEVINPISYKFKNEVKNKKDEFENIFKSHNMYFQHILNQSFEETKNSVYNKSKKHILETIEEKNKEINKLDKILCYLLKNNE